MGIRGFLFLDLVGDLRDGAHVLVRVVEHHGLELHQLSGGVVAAGGLSGAGDEQQQGEEDGRE